MLIWSSLGLAHRGSTFAKRTDSRLSRRFTFGAQCKLLLYAVNLLALESDNVHCA